MKTLIQAVILLAMLYIIVSGMVFAFRHPHLTDTERLLRIGDALLWRSSGAAPAAQPVREVDF